MTKTFGFTIEESEIAPGTVGPVFEELPALTTAIVRPYVWAILMHRTGVRSHEVVNALSAVSSVEDMKIDDFDEYGRTRVEICVDTVLAEMVAEGLLDYNDDEDLWVLRYSLQAVPTVIKAVSGVNGRMPAHFLLEMAQENR